MLAGKLLNRFEKRFRVERGSVADTIVNQNDPGESRPSGHYPFRRMH
jgi:hypothetical protein